MSRFDAWAYGFSWILAISAMASLQIEHEQRLATAENRMDCGATVVGEIGRRAA